MSYPKVEFRFLSEEDMIAAGVQDGAQCTECMEDLLKLVLEVASGKQTKTEQKGYREISIFKDGVVL